LGFIYEKTTDKNFHNTYIKNDVLFIPVLNKTDTFIEQKIYKFVKYNTYYEIYSDAYEYRCGRPIADIKIFKDEIMLVYINYITNSIYTKLSYKYRGDRMKLFLENLEKAYNKFKDIERNRL
jgi:hypothetical protein